VNQNDDVSQMLGRLGELFNQGSVVYETAGRPSGVAGVGDVGLAASALSMELAAVSGDLEAAIDAMVRHKEHAPEIFESVLLGTVLNLLGHQLEPAFKILDGTSTDRRARAVREWRALRHAADA
jgi:hypothetical protein